METEYVILLHGIARTYRSMQKIEQALTKSGYRVLNIDYPARKKTIHECAAWVYPKVRAFAEGAPGKIHFVTHSMGGLVVRELLGNFHLTALGRIVMIAPPNHGSEVADCVKNWFFYRQFFGPAGQELTTTFAKTQPFPQLQSSFGVIAGNRCWDPITYFMLPPENDGRVTVKSTELAHMRDHLVVPCTHPFIMKNGDVIKQIHAFLKEGQFYRAI